GVIQRHFTEDMLGHSSATVVVAGSMQVAFLNLVGSPAGIAAERFGYRVVLMAGCLLSMVGLLLASFVNADNLWLLVLSHGALIGSAAALLVIPLCSIPTVWFLKRRGLANGILMAANGISGLAFPPLMQKLIDTVGIHWTLRIFILVVAVIGGIPSWFIHESNHASIGAKLRAVLGLVADFSLLQNKPFIVVSILNFTSGCAFFIPYQYLPTYATRQGFTTDQAALLASLLGAGQIIGGFGGGLLMDYIGVYNLLVLVQLLSTLTPAVLWTLSQQFSVLVAFSVTYGIASGAGVLTTGPSVAVLFDVRRVPSALGMLFL
ncbi:MFS general substrate transporter, partial [Ramicandelaber brevisporus]